MKTIMNLQKGNPTSTATKMQQAYWEAKRNIRISLGKRDDDCLIANDAELDAKIELLQSADTNFDTIASILLKYHRSLNDLMLAEEKLGSALIEYGVKDATKAGKMMAVTGKVINRSSDRRSPLKGIIMKLYHEIQTFQFKATVDVFLAVDKLEKVRKSYRSGLLWMKNESQNLDPDVSKKLNKFRKIQEHIRNLKIRFDKTKLDVMQKIDLYLLSRCNLFSQTLIPYQKTFCKMSKYCIILSKDAINNIPFCMSYKFETLKELNSYKYSTVSQICLACHLNSSKGNRNSPGYTSTQHLCKLGKIGSNHVHKKQNSKSYVSKLTSKQTPIKKSKSKFSLESKSSNTTSNKYPEALLINLNDELQTSLLSLPKVPSTSSLMNGKYSSDLLSIDLNEFQINDVSKTQEGSGDTHEEFEKCLDLMESFTTPPLEASDHGLWFWSLMEDYGKNMTSSAISDAKASTNAKDIKSENCNISADSLWENVLIEFDPFTNYKSMCKKTRVFDEIC